VVPAERGRKVLAAGADRLKHRGVQDVLIACVDGLKGFHDAIEAVFPLYIGADLHRASDPPQPALRSRREREQVARDLRPIYTATGADTAKEALEQFDQRWGERFPSITKSWNDAWEQGIPFLAFPPEVRRVIQTTNAIEALNRQLRKAINTKGHFPNEEAASKLIYLAITNATPAWTKTRSWTKALLRSKSTSETDCPNTPPTQKTGQPHPVLGCMVGDGLGGCVFVGRSGDGCGGVGGAGGGGVGASVAA
jgi:putative transposase